MKPKTINYKKLTAYALVGSLILSALSSGNAQTSTSRRTTTRNSNQNTSAMRTASNYYYDPYTVYSLYPGGYVISNSGYVVNGFDSTGYPAYTGNFAPSINPINIPGIVNNSGTLIIGSNGIQYAPPSYGYLPAVYPTAPTTDNAANTGPNANIDTTPKTPQNTTPRVYSGNIPPVVYERLQVMARDIAQGWHDGDIALIRRYVDSKSKVAVYREGKYQYTLRGGSFTELLRRAVVRQNSTAYYLDEPIRLKPNIYLITGTHSYRDAQNAEKTMRVSYVVSYRNRRLYLLQTGADAAQAKVKSVPDPANTSGSTTAGAKTNGGTQQNP